MEKNSKRKEQYRNVLVIDDLNEVATRKIFGDCYGFVSQRWKNNMLSSDGKLCFLIRYEDYDDAEFNKIRKKIMRRYPNDDILIFRENPDGLPF